MCSGSTGKLYGCIPIPFVILPVAAFTLFLEFIFFVLYLVIAGGTDAPITKAFVLWTFDLPIHCLLVASTFVLILTTCFRMPALAVPYGIMAIVTVLWGLSKTVEIIIVVNGLATYLPALKAGLKAANRGEMSLAADNEWTAGIIAIIWNLFVAALYGTCAGLVIVCAKIMSTNSSAAQLNLPFRIGGGAGRLPEASPTVAAQTPQ